MRYSHSALKKPSFLYQELDGRLCVLAQAAVIVVGSVDCLDLGASVTAVALSCVESVQPCHHRTCPIVASGVPAGKESLASSTFSKIRRRRQSWTALAYTVLHGRGCVRHYLLQAQRCLGFCVLPDNDSG
mmetsp:Transcript_6135/g.22570  ORF Transcript_6135/g.22570 Transcript_6135/m.22570 type:complete len:130 (+) Transcript_6135:2941-3330(+)